MNVVFDFGENKHIRIMVHSMKRESFVITDASYILTKKGSQQQETSGICSINEHIIDTIISPKERGEYILKITYHIADETLIDDVYVLVL